MEIDSPSPSSLAPLPTELARVSSLSSSASQAGLDTILSLIDQLEAAKARLQAGENPGQDLSAMRFKLAGQMQAVEKKQKDWLGAVGKFGKSVDKVRNVAHAPQARITRSRVGRPRPERTLAALAFSGSVDIGANAHRSPQKFATPLEPVFPPPASATTSAPVTRPTLLSLHAPTAPLPTHLPSPPTVDLYPGPFSSPEAVGALNETIALHLARIGAFDTLSTFLAESGTAPIPAPTLRDLQTLHAILAQLGKGHGKEALRWIERERSRGREVDAGGELEFALHRDAFVRLLLGTRDTTTEPLLPQSSAATQGSSAGRSVPAETHTALAYGHAHFTRLCTPERLPEISALFTSTVFLPLSRLLVSPYASIYAEYTAAVDLVDGGESAAPPPTVRLQAMFAASYLKQLGLPQESPLSVVTDVGGGGALARIQKVRNVMREKKTEWSAKGELPVSRHTRFLVVHGAREPRANHECDRLRAQVEIPLPSQYRFHSIFACPVSKEQATENNPPMLLPCGHVIARESLARLARGTA